MSEKTSKDDTGDAADGSQDKLSSLVGNASAHVATEVASAPAIDETFASDIHDFRQLLVTRDREGLVSALENPDLFRMACDDERYLRIALRGVGVLAWSDPAKAGELLVHYDGNRLRELANSDARQAARALMAALEWKQLETEKILVGSEADALRDFLCLAPAFEGDPPHAAALAERLATHPGAFADLSATLARHAPALSTYIYQLATGRSPEESRSSDVGEADLSALHSKQREALESAAARLSKAVERRPWHLLPWLVATAAAVAHPSAISALAALCIAGFGIAIVDRRVYPIRVRPELVTLAASYGVGARALVHYGDREGRGGRVLRRFDREIENDLALELLAALTRLLRRGDFPQPGT